MATPQTNTLLEAALAYAARGWHVFPCHTPWQQGCSCKQHQTCPDIGKHPRWHKDLQHGLKDATTDVATLTRWWTRWPMANIGIATGAVSRLVVLDNDIYKGGDTSLHDLERSYSPLPATVLSLTGGGGEQYFFQHPGSPVKNGVDCLGVGLDIRGDGGYVIAPPSLHKSGKRYVWEVVHEPDETPLAPLPDWVLALCQQTVRQDRKEAGAPIPDHQRNATLFHLGAGMRGRGFTEAVILAALREMNATQCLPPLTDAEVQKIVGSIAKYEAGPSPEALHQQRNGQAPAPDPQPSLAEAIVSYAELQTLQIPKREVFLDWLSERSLVMVYGPRGVGKTMIMLGIAVSLTTGQPFLKWPVQRHTGVLYLDGEMSADELRDRATLMVGGTAPECLAFLPSELVQARLDRDLTLATAAARQEIDAVLDARPALRVLILDNASCLFPGISENDKHDWEPINAWFIRLRHRGMTVILGHHAGKGGHQRGTSAREDALNTVLALSLPPGYKAEDGCHFYLRFEKARGIKGPTVEGLDVRFDETPDGSGWTYQALEVERTERIKLMLADAVPPRIIAEELGISASYVYRMKRYLGL